MFTTTVEHMIEAVNRDNEVGGVDGPFKKTKGPHKWEFTYSNSFKTICQELALVYEPEESTCSY